MTLPDSAAGAVPPSYSVLLEGPESTVCAVAPAVARDSTAYQSEAELEDELITQLVDQGYERVDITSEPEMVANLRRQIERLNGFSFPDADWERFMREKIARRGEGVREKTARIQRHPIEDFTFDDGQLRNVTLLDRQHIYRNTLQVMHQYGTDEGSHGNRYDVTVLVNGLPLVHIELKRRGVELEEAFNQIERYQRESFWSGSGLFEYVQVFVISNGRHTKYYSNTTRLEKTGAGRPGGRSHASFQQTSWWADADNNEIRDLVPFAATFLSKGTLLMLLTHYCVFDATDTLLVMRPYQVCACERVLNRILVSEYDKKRLGTTAAGGYIWHTTGSGKTLTSFKCAQLASQMEGVDKVLFVVDRKDLDYQTMREYDRFQKGAVNGSNDTRELARNLEAGDAEHRICVTTINKLACYLRGGRADTRVFSRHTVFIFDECHRSQFGKMHTAITKAFKNYHLFGFTGTPIFAANAGGGADPQLRTTEQAFGDCLHRYTVVDAIRDKCVLPFRIDYVRTFKEGDRRDESEVEGIDTASAWQDPRRIKNVSEYILDHFDQKTKRQGGRRRGFSSILACDSIGSAKAYYRALRELVGRRAGCERRIAVIFTCAVNGPQVDGGFLPDEAMGCEGMEESDREFLEGAVGDYNAMFGTGFGIDQRGFDDYYKDVSRRLRGTEAGGGRMPAEECLDLLIVVNMFLTGFDAKTLNTLWVDKNLRMHGLIQAFSRTNRVLDSVKSFGNIVCFRDLSQEVDEALALFGDGAAGGTVRLKPYEEYLEEYCARLAELRGSYPLADPQALRTDEAKRGFANTFSSVLRLRNVLECFDEFEGDDTAGERELQDYQSEYLAVRDEIAAEAKAGKESIADDLTFEMELVRQVEINIDYILMLVERRSGEASKDKEVAARVRSCVSASPELRDKADLIERFLASAGFGDEEAEAPVDPEAGEAERHEDVAARWRELVAAAMEEDLGRIIHEERLRDDATRRLVADAFEQGEVPSEGTAVARVLPRGSRFGAAAAEREETRRRVCGRLQAFYEKYRSLTAHYPIEGAGA